MSKRRFQFFVPFMLVALLNACGKDQVATEAASQKAAEPPAAGPAEPTGIPWFDGSVEQAFAYARDSKKPVFLYWGAAWCPPCNQLKATVFQREEFIRQSRQVVPVYLDGDTPSAQEQGDRFGVYGYPTVIVLTADGEEITRIPGGLDLERYLDILQLTLAESRPVRSLVADALAGKTLDDGDWRLLAAYSWGQDNGRILQEEDDAVTIFRDLARACPSHLATECSQFSTEAVNRWSRDEERDPLHGAMFLVHLASMLGDDELSRANLEFVIYAGKRVIPTVVDVNSQEGLMLISAWQQQLYKLRDDMSVSSADRLGTWIGELRLASLTHETIPEQLQQSALKAVQEMDAAIEEKNERLAMMNSAWGVLDTAGLDEEASALLQKELETSHSPYYFMLDLASTAKKTGRSEEALVWLERAWRESVGEATRLQWGANYLLGIIELSPDNSARVTGLTAELLDEVARMENAFHGRNARVLNRIFKSLGEWADTEAHLAEVDGLRDRAQEMCALQNPLGCDARYQAIAATENQAPATG